MFKLRKAIEQFKTDFKELDGTSSWDANKHGLTILKKKDQAAVCTRTRHHLEPLRTTYQDTEHLHKT